jgi:type III pantothenate kinase
LILVSANIETFFNSPTELNYFFLISMKFFKMKILVVDAGNTRIKVGTFYESTLCDVSSFLMKDKKECFDYLKSLTYDQSILSSVLSEEKTNEILQQLNSSAISLTEITKIPISIEYESRTTLGKDRLANAVAAYQKAKKNVLVIDVGTCVKFDFVNNNGAYLGGSISPGLQMRFSAMHEHTENLPLLKNINPTKLIGNSTVNSMNSGVMNGTKYEIEGMIKAYQHEFKDLVIFATGGDVGIVELDQSFPIIYEEHLTLNGLYEILQKQHD